MKMNFDIYQEKVYIFCQFFISRVSRSRSIHSKFVRTNYKPRKIKPLKIYQQKKTQLNQQPAHILVYSRTEEQILVKQMEIFTIRNNRIYTIIYTAEMNKYQKFLGLASKLIDSLEIYNDS